MTEGIELMKNLGFIDTTDKHDKDIIRQFTKYNDKGYITDIINYFYSKEVGVEVFTNNLKHQCGSRLDRILLNAVSLNYDEVEFEALTNHIKNVKNRKSDYDNKENKK